MVTPDAILESAEVRIESGRIVDIREGVRRHNGEDSLDAQGCLLLPGFVDIHADSLEMAIAPRPTAPFEPAAVLPSYEAQLAMNGFTTVFHCVGLGDLGELGKPLRTRKMAEELVRTIGDFATEAHLRTCIHLRYEIIDTASLPLLHTMIEESLVDLVSLMDHTPGCGVFKNSEDYRDYFRRSGQSLAAADLKIAKLLELHTGIDWEALKSLVCSCRKHGLTVVSHDDHTAEKIDWAADLGITVAEFPVTMEAAEHARRHNMRTVFGTPNLIRGTSHAGNLRVADLLAEGLVDILCLDYSPMCSLPALFKAVELTGAPLAELTRIFTLNPARAVGLGEITGSIEEGKAADLILVDTRGALPRVLATFVGGQPVYRTIPTRALVN